MDAGPPTPAGTAIETGSGFNILGVTGDGYVVYTGPGGLLAAPVAGGAQPTVLSTTPAAQLTAYILNNDVFILSATIDSGLVGSLSVWSSTLSGPKLVSANCAGAGLVSADSSTFVYAGDVSPDGRVGTLFGVTLSTLDAPVAIATNVDLDVGSHAFFTGTTPPFDVVLSYGVAGNGDGGLGGPVNAYLVSTDTWKPRLLAPDVACITIPDDCIWVDDDARYAAILLASGELETVPLGQDGGAPVPIANLGAMTGVNLPQVLLSGSDSFLLYNAGSALEESPVVMSNATTVDSVGGGVIVAESRNQGWVEYLDSNEDLSLLSTALPETRSLLASALTEEFGFAFTADSSYAIYMRNFSQVPADYDASVAFVGTVGTLYAVAASGTPGATRTVASNVYTLQPVLPLRDAKIVFNTNVDVQIPIDGGTTGGVDIRVVDLSQSAAPTLVMHRADPLFVASADGRYIVYTINYGGSTDGIYSVAAP